MSDADPTVPYRPTGVPVKEVRVETTSGPQAGQGATSTDDPITIGSAEGNDIRLQDRTVSRFHLEVSRRGDRLLVTDLGSTNGTFLGDVCLRDASATVPPGALIRVGKAELRLGDGATQMPPAPAHEELGPIRGRSEVMQRIMDRVAQLARTEVPVLLVGESGTGKELLARALHEQGHRAAGPVITVDCGAIPQNLFESTLFGHERGAFTGADKQRAGAFERAHGGTIFLDEIGELAPDQQVALLGILERRRFTRVGGTTEQGVDVRVVAATNRDLRAEVNEGTFRLDLYYRLAVVTLKVPPLRERPEDIPLLIERFLMEEGVDRSVEDVFGRDMLDQLQRHRWPGNVRELKNLVNATLAIGEPPELLMVDAAPAGSSDAELLGLPYREAKAVVTGDFERRYLENLLRQTGGNVLQASKLARMNRSYLIELLRRHGLKK